MTKLAYKAISWLTACVILCATLATQAVAAPYAALVMDARTGQVLHSENADTRLHPASLTKMMTLYIAFQAISRGEVSLETPITVTQAAASQPPSRLGLRNGQRIQLQYLIRAAAIKSANDAATAIGIGISGSEQAFAARMNATARAMGMNNSHFISMNGLTTEGHYSTARDMSILGRHLIYDFPQYYNLFSRRSADAGIATVRTTNSRLLDNYSGADGIKTGYTQAAGYNLTASAERGNVRIIATVFGATSNADRHARITRLLDQGFANAPRNARVRTPDAPPAFQSAPPAAAPASPPARPQAAPDDNFDMNALIAAVSASAGSNAPAPTVPQAASALRPMARPGQAPSPVAEAVAVAVAEAPAEPVPLPFQMIDNADLSAITSEEPEEAGGTTDAIEAAIMMASATPVTRPMMRPATATTVVASAEPAPVPTAIPVAEAAPEREPAPQPEAAPVVTAAVSPEEAPIALEAAFGSTPAQPETLAMLDDGPQTSGETRPTTVIMTTAEITPAASTGAQPQVVSRMSTSGGRLYGVSIGRFNSSYAAERELMRVAMMEAGLLSSSQRTVSQSPRGFDANFTGMTREEAELACGRLQARSMACTLLDTN
ncbi:D-alanyl-D-alanine carboxypeptidase (penicillin-binding protein 5/6) [Ketogulonicigenium robustum]|uniref:D-alanyl-D-alanine carboxypeptidase (Penicillin-binding protein 5/6) n=1 Tax=Ketogulonicigenium robustum TaxID=92947 RepID=A0A1W6NXS0_9RHOB|nr:serine hydrolase [Ketogulonicigenium robustum]ARO14045.1 D-alanyl-D-alanine carboxypeptidase (penicillin-binding protein 5/6) [Ketogulonicigenium robustum]